MPRTTGQGTRFLPSKPFKLPLPEVVAHRGASKVAPENTLAAVAAAAEAGASMVEVDVKLSADGVPFLLHDATLERTTDGSGPASALRMEELQRFDAGSWFAAGFAGERLPTLDGLIALLDRLDLSVNVEVKPSPGFDEATAEGIVATLRRSWPADRPWPLLSSFSLKVMERLKEIAPDMPRGLITERLPGDLDAVAKGLELTSLHLGGRGLSHGVVRHLADSGWPVLVWTVNDPAAAKAWLDAGAAAVITDDPKTLLDALQG